MPTQRPTLLLALLCLCMAIGVSSLSATLVSDRQDAQQDLSNTIDLASQSYRERTSASAMKSFHEKVLKDMSVRLAAEGKTKRSARFALADTKRKLKNLQELQLGRTEEGRRKAVRGIGDSEDRMSSILREKFLQSSPTDATNVSWIQSLMNTNGQEPIDSGTRTMMLQGYGETWDHFVALTNDGTMDVLRVQDAAKTAQQELAVQSDALNTLRETYLEDLKTSERARDGLVLSDRELARAKVDAAEVHRVVLKMQADLARIDSQLRQNSANSLVEMGLLSAAPDDPQIAPESMTFLWPVHGPIAAGFHDPLYKKFFGIPHNAVDIMTNQGTQVRSAADGIVFLVKDGGALGYTYVLIGHRDGYATLYGHLSLVQVAPRQKIQKGDVIGLSGGTPGTLGAGPTTTGPHLHFEVILNGSNIDPMLILKDAAV